MDRRQRVTVRGVGVELVVLIVFASAFVLTRALARGWRWIVALGAVGALAWWAWTLSGGCDQESEIRCGWQPVVSWISTLLLFAAWLAGVGAALLLRRRFRGSQSRQA